MKSCADCWLNRPKDLEQEYGRCHVPGEVCGKWEPLNRKQEPHSAKALYRKDGGQPHLFSRGCCIGRQGAVCKCCGTRVDANDAREYAWGLRQ